MLVGVVSGTYSTVFIASAIAILLSKKPQAGRDAGRRRGAGEPQAEGRQGLVVASRDKPVAKPRSS